MGHIYNAQGKGEEALEAFRKGLTIREELVAGEPERTDFRYNLGVSYNHVGTIYKAQGKGDEALEAYQKYLTIMEELVAGEPERTDFRRDLSASYNNVGHIYKAQGKGEEALEAFRKGLTIREELVAGEPERTEFLMDQAISCWNIYLICPKEDELHWLQRARKVLIPLKLQRRTHGQFTQLWQLVNKALSNRQ